MTRTKTSRLGHVVQGLHMRAEADERGGREVSLFLVIRTPTCDIYHDVAFQDDTTDLRPLSEDEVIHPLESGPPTHTLDNFTFVLDNGSAADLNNIDEPGYVQRIYAQGMVCVRSLEAQEEDDAEEQAAEPDAPAGCLFTKVGPITKWFAGDGVMDK